MKKDLTIEQSTRLLEFGVDARRASNFTSTVMLDVHGYECYDAKPIFTLVDVIELLPTTIYSEERDVTYSLHIIKSEFQSVVSYRHYANSKGFGPTKSSSELIDALYQILIWTIQNKYCTL